MRTRQKTEAERLEQCLLHARSPSGCHALSVTSIRLCDELVTQGLVYKGPFKNIDGAPVYFAYERDWRLYLSSSSRMI